ncbi:MAG: PdxA family protein [Gemmatimonadota bacterium]
MASLRSETSVPRPRIALTCGDPRGIGPEVIAGALGDAAVRAAAEYVLIGPERLIPAGTVAGAEVRFEPIGRWPAPGPGPGEVEAGRLSGSAVERAIELALRGEVDGVVTAPLSKRALAAAGYPYPGHTELLQARTGVPEVTMMMAAERTSLGGPLRLALLTTHIALRDVPSELTVERAVRRAGIAVAALREWWGMSRPRIAWAALNPHASEGGLFGDEEERVLEHAAARLTAEGGCENLGIFPADTVFRRCLDGSADAVVVPYHDVGLAVLKTIAPEAGVNITAGLPFPRTSPDHGTAFDIAGRGICDARSMTAAILLCARFCGVHAALSR